MKIFTVILAKNPFNTRLSGSDKFLDVTVAKDGQEAFELVKESMEQRKYFNLIFMDVQVILQNAVYDCRELTLLFRCPILMVYKAPD